MMLERKHFICENTNCRRGTQLDRNLFIVVTAEVCSMGLKKHFISDCRRITQLDRKHLIVVTAEVCSKGLGGPAVNTRQRERRSFIKSRRFQSAVM